MDHPAAGRGHGYLKVDLCCYSPESYSLEEKRDICNEMVSTSTAVLDAMRAHFERLPSDARSKLLDRLCQSGDEALNGGGTFSLAREIRCIEGSKLSNAKAVLLIGT